jgi:hypothetical protein
LVGGGTGVAGAFVGRTSGWATVGGSVAAGPIPLQANEIPRKTMSGKMNQGMCLRMGCSSRMANNPILHFRRPIRRMDYFMQLYAIGISSLTKAG